MSTGRARIKVEDRFYEEHVVERVDDTGAFWAVKVADGLTFNLEKSYGVESRPGQRVRTYLSRGPLPLGDAVRGVDLDGEEVFYRTPQEELEYQRTKAVDEARKVRERYPDADERYRDPSRGLPFPDALALGLEEKLAGRR